MNILIRQLAVIKWINVGMALKHEGYAVSDWDMWSEGQQTVTIAVNVQKKWATFQGSSAPVTANYHSK